MNSMNNEHSDQQLQSFSYPLSIKIFFLFLVCGIFLYVPYFLYCELPYHRQVSNQLKNADKLFDQKNYLDAILIYMKIADNFESFKYSRIRLAQACFASSHDNNENCNALFSLALNYLTGNKFSVEEIADLEKYVPTWRINDFKRNFTVINEKNKAQ